MGRQGVDLARALRRKHGDKWVRELLSDLEAGTSCAAIARRCHVSRDMPRRWRDALGTRQVVYRYTVDPEVAALLGEVPCDS